MIIDTVSVQKGLELLSPACRTKHLHERPLRSKYGPIEARDRVNGFAHRNPDLHGASTIYRGGLGRVGTDDDGVYQVSRSTNDLCFQIPPEQDRMNASIHEPNGVKMWVDDQE
jgi:hypothetical protein